jgi:hypothetical protein
MVPQMEMESLHNRGSDLTIPTVMPDGTRSGGYLNRGTARLPLPYFVVLSRHPGRAVNRGSAITARRSPIWLWCCGFRDAA